ncbi:MAG: hypothetical protein WDW38_002677 [Sanguina aurantia]
MPTRLFAGLMSFHKPKENTIWIYGKDCSACPSDAWRVSRRSEAAAVVRITARVPSSQFYHVLPAAVVAAAKPRTLSHLIPLWDPSMQPDSVSNLDLDPGVQMMS